MAPGAPGGYPVDQFDDLSLAQGAENGMSKEEKRKEKLKERAKEKRRNQRRVSRNSFISVADGVAQGSLTLTILLT